MLNQELDLRDRDTIYPGLAVKIITNEREKLEGIVKKKLTITKFDFNGVLVELESGKIGHVIKAIQTESERESRELIVKFNLDIAQDEGQFLEFKETFAYNASRSDGKPDKKIMFVVGKTVQAFANKEGGTLYIGIKDRTKEKMSLDRDYSLLETNQDADGLEIRIRQKLEKFFQRKLKIFRVVSVKIIKIEGKDVCVINVLPSRFPFILHDNGKEYYHRRIGNSSEPCTVNEFMDEWEEHLDELRL